MPEADLIITNAKALTLDPKNPVAHAVAIRANRILYAGNEKDALSLKTANTTIIDAQAKTLMPGIIDSHFHLLWGSLNLLNISLEGVKGLNAVKDKVLAYKRQYPEKRVLRASGVGYDVLPAGERLTRHHLDGVEAELPLILTCFDFHNVWCNTAALKAAGILHGADVGSNAEVVIGKDGLATGELREFEAMDLVFALLPEARDNEKLEALRQGIKLAQSYGITSIHNMDGNQQDFALYQQLDRAQELGLRVYLPFSLKPEMPLSVIEDEALAMRDDYQSPMLRAGALKLFMDGVVEAFTAFMLEPYHNAATCGDAIFSAEHFGEVAARADKHGLQIAVHAIGDAAVRRTLDGFAYAREQNGQRDSRHRIEHIELLHPTDLPRFKDLGVIASMQPYHCTRPEAGYLTSWMRFIGERRYDDSFAWQRLRETEAQITFGSDWPVVTLNPFAGIHAAVSREPWLEGLSPQAQSLEQSLAGYTRDGAYSEFMEHEKGQLKAGMLADLVLLSKDIAHLPAEKLAEVQATMTVCDGKIVYQA